MDCFQCPTVFTNVSEEATTLVLAGVCASTRQRQHLVDIFDFDIYEVVFFREVKCVPVVVILEYVSDGERDISKKTEENYDEMCYG